MAGCAPGAPEVEGAAPASSVRYVGDETCATCHADLYASYHTTGMGRSVSRFDPATAPERFDADGRSPVVCHEPSGYCYQAFVRGDTLYQREFRPDTPGYERIHAASHVVGSGNATRSYFMTVGAEGEPGGYVTEMPLTWYVERAIWDLSPGYEYNNDRFERPIVLHCMACHNGPPTAEPGPLNYYADVPLGITCERCHGPGAAHAEARLADEGGGGPDPTIVNPARLDASLQLAVCQQCHLEGLAVFAPGEDPTTFRPGQPLDAHRAVFARAEQLDDPDAFGISSQALRMMQSACFTATQGTAMALTCTTCHDPHRPNADLGPDHFNDACRSCHDGNAHDAVCTRPAVGGGLAGAMTGDCVGCHMQQGGTSDIPHVTFTDHWIRRTLPPARPPEAIERGRLPPTPFRLVEVTARERALAGGGPAARSEAEAALAEGIAYWAFYETHHRLPAYLPTVTATIRRGLAGGADRPDAHDALGGALLAMDSLAAAEAAFARGAERWPDAPDLRLGLAEVRRRRGNAAGAVAPLRAAVEQYPHHVEARLKLAGALAAVGRTDEALAAYREALRRDPVHHAEGWNNLGFLLLRDGRHAEAVEPLRRSVALTPTSAEARANLGAALLGQGDLDGAAEQFEAALRYRPDYTPALGNLGVIRMRQGRTADARRLFERVLALTPDDPQARAYLQQLGSP